MPLGMVVTDLDGTLLDSRQVLTETDRRTLAALGRRGVLRAVATGRALSSALAVLPPDAPIDYLCHSSGAGITRWSDRAELRSINMPHLDAAALAAELVRRELDFMLLFALPHSHHGYAHQARPGNADFERRLSRYRSTLRPLRLPLAAGQQMSQALVIASADVVVGGALHAELALAFPAFQVIRATSPLDGVSTWIEIFPRGVHKASAAAWLRESAAPVLSSSMAVGNDHNDLQLLDWADLAYVVANAPPELRARYTTVASNDEGGFSDAVRRAFGSV